MKGVFGIFIIIEDFEDVEEVFMFSLGLLRFRMFLEVIWDLDWWG